MVQKHLVVHGLDGTSTVYTSSAMWPFHHATADIAVARVRVYSVVFLYLPYSASEDR